MGALQVEADSHARYEAFVENVEEDSLAPIQQEWIDNACAMTNMEVFPALPEDQLNEMVDDMLIEMNDMYIRSVKTSIAEYVLLNPKERERLQIYITPRESALERKLEFSFGDSLQGGINMPPEDWGHSVTLAREVMAHSLFTVNACALELQNTWMTFENQLLLDVRLDGSHRASELDRYKVAQVDHAESVRNTLRKKWYPAVLRTFLRPDSEEGLQELVPSLPRCAMHPASRPPFRRAVGCAAHIGSTQHAFGTCRCTRSSIFSRQLA